MSDKTKIEWTDATWNPVTGCTRVSPGCENCYIDWAPPFRIEGRHFTVPCEHCGGTGFEPMTGKFRDGHACSICKGEGKARSHAIGSTTGVRLHPERLDQPLRWKRPRKVFVNSLSDLFHDEVSDEYIAQVFAVMALAPQHTFQILTKRHARMRSLLGSASFRNLFDAETYRVVSDAATAGALPRYRADAMRDRWWRSPWPLPNVWVGVTVEDQERADLRIPALLDTPAAVRFLSCEPLLGGVRLCRCDGAAFEVKAHPFIVNDSCPLHGAVRVDWVIAGGESGPGARPMHPDWARTLRDDCRTVDVPFLFKQWGEWVPKGFQDPEDSTRWVQVTPNPRDDRDRWVNSGAGGVTSMRRVGKKAAGRELDGRTWDEYPEAGR